MDGLRDFQFETIPDSLPPLNSNATQDVASLCASIMKNFLAPFFELLLKLNSATSNAPLVTCIILDILMQFTIIAAQELGTVIIMFSSIFAYSLMVFTNFPSLMDKGLIPLKGITKNEKALKSIVIYD